MKKYLFYIMIFFLIFWAVFYFVEHSDELKELLQVKPLYMIGMLLACISQPFVSGLFTRLILKPHGIKIKIKELLALTIFTSLGNYLLPLGGMGFRAVYLKKRHNFSYPYFLSSMAGVYLIYFLTNSLLGLGALSLLYYYWDIVSLELALIFVLVTIAAFIPFLLPTKRLFPKRETSSSGDRLLPSVTLAKGIFVLWTSLTCKMVKFFYQIMEGCDYFKKSPSLIFQMILLTFLNNIISMTLLFFGFLSSSVKPGILGLVMVSATLGISAILSITPAAIGIQESAIIFSSKILNIT
ncbi:MAG: lysylphosphatidylglycerol synthase transmembrane domain-containing protein, partial [bacterium]|nr:lysylphosphatidylglycerol synthase transmembrane domain-containing protein [bacterium]